MLLLLPITLSNSLTHTHTQLFNGTLLSDDEIVTDSINGFVVSLAPRGFSHTAAAADTKPTHTQGLVHGKLKVLTSAEKKVPSFRCR